MGIEKEPEDRKEYKSKTDGVKRGKSGSKRKIGISERNSGRR